MADILINASEVKKGPQKQQTCEWTRRSAGQFGCRAELSVSAMKKAEHSGPLTKAMQRFRPM